MLLRLFLVFVLARCAGSRGLRGTDSDSASSPSTGAEESSSPDVAEVEGLAHEHHHFLPGLVHHWHGPHRAHRMHALIKNDSVAAAAAEAAEADSPYKKLMSAVTIRYPLDAFSKAEDWRQKGVFNDAYKTNDFNKGWIAHSHAQDEEDVWLFEHFFYGMEKGVIMESGALDGDEFSTSNMFVKYLNWTAIHVEADPDNYGRLVKNRPDGVNVHAALCSEPRLLHWSNFGSVNAVKGFVEFMPMDFLKRWHRTVFNNDSMVEYLPAVKCMTVKKLLRELNVHHVDIWILDTEGSEESVLQGVDFDAVTFNAIAMECDEYDHAKNNRKMDFLRNRSFDCQLMYRNCICKNKSFEPRQAKEKSDVHIGRGKRFYFANWNYSESVSTP